MLAKYFSYKKIIWYQTVLLLVYFFLNDAMPYSAALMALCSGIVYLMLYIRQRNLSFLRFSFFHVYMLLFALFCYLSAAWAWEPGEAAEAGSAIIKVFLCISAFYFYYLQYDSTEDMLKALVWSINIIMLVLVFSYGPAEIINLLITQQRISNEVMNSNVIGLISAIHLLISFYLLSDRKKPRRSDIFCVLSLIFVALSGSRKALVFLIAGIFLLIVFKAAEGKPFSQAAKSILLISLCFLAAQFLVLQLPMFSMIKERTLEMLQAFINPAAGDSSTHLRQELFEVGMQQFYKTPLLGIGIGSSRRLMLECTGNYWYAHNNFVELLCCGGIVGFAVFYSMYAYLFFNMIKYRKYGDKFYKLIIILMLLLFVMDFGMVSYYSKDTYYYYMLFFLYVRKLRSAAEKQSV